MASNVTPSDHSRQKRLDRHIGMGRRSFLRGLGVTLALPSFESLIGGLQAAEPAQTAAVARQLGATASGAPLRSLFLYFPNGTVPSAWWPEKPGADFTLSRSLKPLEPLRQHIQVLGGLDHEMATAGPDGAGDHARANGTFLTGVRMKKSATDIRSGISIDQMMANHVGHLTRFSSLELTAETHRASGSCDSGYSCAYQYNLSWASETMPMTPESSPRAIFERLFGAGAPGQRTPNLKIQRDQQKSLLDYVLSDAKAMSRKMAARDREKLDQYLTGVRELEHRIQKAERLGDAKDPGVPTPGNSTTYGEHISLMADMLVLAFQSDSTRVATLALAHDGSNRSFADIGVPEGHHDLSHHFDNPEKVEKITQIDTWYSQQFALLLTKLSQATDIDGKTLLDNSMVVYGGGNADGNKHTHSNLPLILAGGAGGALKTGRYVDHGSKPMSNLLLSMADIMGIQGLDRFGDSTGRLANI